MDSVVLVQASPGAGSEVLWDREKVARGEDEEIEATLHVPKLGRQSASQQTGQGQDPFVLQEARFGRDEHQLAQQSHCPGENC